MYVYIHPGSWSKRVHIVYNGVRDKTEKHTELEESITPG